MITRHTFRAVCRCPVDSTLDVYEVTVTTESVIPVESILRAASALAEESMYQEDFTRELADGLPMCAVVTNGVHSGVQTVCEDGKLLC